MSATGDTSEPVTRSRPNAPGYGIPSHRRGMLSWDHVEERMAKYGMGSRDAAGSYVVRPRVAFAWSAGSPRTYTRWVFDYQPATRP